MSKIAVIRVRGGINTNPEFTSTFKMLNLVKKNHCIVIENTPSLMGMVKKVKDFITWGPIDNDTLSELIKKRTEKTVTNDGKKEDKKYFRLNPPKKGYGRKGIKITFKAGGALGDRAEKINDLIRRML